MFLFSFLVYAKYVDKFGAKKKKNNFLSMTNCEIKLKTESKNKNNVENKSWHIDYVWIT